MRKYVRCEQLNDPEELFEQIKSIHYQQPTLMRIEDINCKVDSDYQRDLTERTLKKLYTEFDVDLFAPILVSLREDGKYHVIDGQHRYFFALDIGFKEILCVIKKTRGAAHEAQIFKKVNTASTPLTTYAKFNSDVSSGERVPNHIVSIALRHGITVAPSNGVRRINIVSTLLKYYNLYGPAYLDMTFRVIKEAYPNDAEALKSTFFVSLIEFLFAAEQDPVFKLNEFIRVLRNDVSNGNTAKMVTAQIKSSKGEGSSRTALRNAAIQQFSEKYNKHKPNSSKYRIKLELA